MWRLALRDLQWRRRRLVISMLGTSLVFTMALVLAGLASSFNIEANDLLTTMGGDAWVAHGHTAGPITSGLPIPSLAVIQVGALHGVSEVAGFVFSAGSIGPENDATDVNIFGISPGDVGDPSPVLGRQPDTDSQVMIDDALPYRIGQDVVLGTKRFRVVGLLHHSTLMGGIPNVFLTLPAAQELLYGSRDLVNAVITKGVPAAAPPGYKVFTRSQVETDMTRPVAKAHQVVDFIELFLWLIAACIIGSVVYLSALEKTRDFAVIKATGGSNAHLMMNLAIQAVAISIGAAVLAAILSNLLAPTFPILVVIPIWALLALPALAIGLGLLASTAGLRRAVGVDPAMAFGGP